MKGKGWWRGIGRWLQVYKYHACLPGLVRILPILLFWSVDSSVNIAIFQIAPQRRVAHLHCAFPCHFYIESTTTNIFECLQFTTSGYSGSRWTCLHSKGTQRILVMVSSRFQCYKLRCIIWPSTHIMAVHSSTSSLCPCLSVYHRWATRRFRRTCGTIVYRAFLGRDITSLRRE